MNEQRLTREKAAFVYGTALERGDFVTMTAVLSQAEQDPALEKIILGLNDASQTEMVEKTMTEAPLTVSPLRKTNSWKFIWQMGTVMGVLCIVTIFILTLIGPQVGQIFTRITHGLDGGSTIGNDFRSSGLSPVNPPVDRDNINAPGELDENRLIDDQSLERLIIRNGSIVMVVEDPRGIREQIEGRVSEMAGAGAFVVSSAENGNTNELPVIRMTIRVPVTEFDETIDWLADTAVSGTNPQRTETAQDVTEEYVDLQARLESMMVARDRLLEIMQSAETTEDLLRTEAQLTAREAEIEALQGRIQYLQQAAALSLIDIQLNPYILSQPIDNSWKPAETVRRAFEGLLNTAQNVADFLIVLAIAILPWLIVLVLLVYVVYRLVQRRRMKSGEAREA